MGCVSTTEATTAAAARSVDADATYYSSPTSLRPFFRERLNVGEREPSHVVRRMRPSFRKGNGADKLLRVHHRSIIRMVPPVAALAVATMSMRHGGLSPVTGSRWLWSSDRQRAVIGQHALLRCARRRFLGVFGGGRSRCPLARKDRCSGLRCRSSCASAYELCSTAAYFASAAEHVACTVLRCRHLARVPVDRCSRCGIFSTAHKGVSRAPLGENFLRPSARFVVVRISVLRRRGAGRRCWPC